MRKKRCNEEHEEALERGCKCSEGNCCCSFPQLVGLLSGELLRRRITSSVPVAARAVIKVDFMHAISSGLLPEQGWWEAGVAGRAAAGQRRCWRGALRWLRSPCPALLPGRCSRSQLTRGHLGQWTPWAFGSWYWRREQCECSPWKGLSAGVVY